MMKKPLSLVVLLCLVLAALVTAVYSQSAPDSAVYLPLVVKPLPTPTATPTSTPGTIVLPTATLTGTETITPDPPISATETATPTSPATGTPGATATNTPVPTATNTVLPSATPTNTAIPTVTSTSEPTATNTAMSTATNTPVPPPSSTPEPTATNTAVPPETEMVIFDWDGPVTKSDRGFPRDEPPMENGDWTQPINYAEGRIYVRFEIISQPVPQDDMKLQFCLWQRQGGNKYGKERCVFTKNVPGTAGTIKCWSQNVKDLYKKGEFQWDQPRSRAAVPIKNGDGKAVSDYNGWNWNGENPNHWYPLDMKATVVIVAKGATFSGWDNYGGGC